ncbi:unnamed protein product [Calicophoron daubneyi]|uniref:C2H2-type domain-containing protein n=1 Tax=Calicophoron daubneyi TaxID=300641 RepID=A0AAV2TVZ5_CALDB
MFLIDMKKDHFKIVQNGDDSPMGFCASGWDVKNENSAVRPNEKAGAQLLTDAVECSLIGVRSGNLMLGEAALCATAHLFSLLPVLNMATTISDPVPPSPSLSCSSSWDSSSSSSPSDVRSTAEAGEEHPMCTKSKKKSGQPISATCLTLRGHYSCSACSQRFLTNTGLRRHILTAHEAQTVQCDQCVKVFRYTSALTEHKKRVHGPREYICGICAAEFTSDSSLRTHVRIHEDKKFTCVECGHCFSNQTDLNNHMRVHNGEKPFSCEVCGKAFRHVSGFYAHIRIHTGETPYTCNLCNKKFSNPSNYRMHQKVHTKDMQFRYNCRWISSVADG